MLSPLSFCRCRCLSFFARGGVPTFLFRTEVQSASLSLGLLMIVAVHQVAGSNPPTDKGTALQLHPQLSKHVIFCDTACIRPVVAIPETPTTGAT